MQSDLRDIPLIRLGHARHRVCTVGLQGRKMLDVRHESRTVIMSWNGPLDEVAADTILAALALIEASPKIVLDLTHAVDIQDTAIARISRSRKLEFNGLRKHHECLLAYLQSESEESTLTDSEIPFTD